MTMLKTRISLDGQVVRDGVIAVYFGAYGHRDRLKIESKSFAWKDGYNQYLRWKDTALSEPRRFRADEVRLVKFRSITLWGAVCQGRFKGHWMERVHHELSGDMEPGRQMLNRVVGAGDPCRGEGGFHHVFDTIVNNGEIAKYPEVVCQESYD